MINPQNLINKPTNMTSYPARNISNVTWQQDGIQYMITEDSLAVQAQAIITLKKCGGNGCKETHHPTLHNEKYFKKEVSVNNVE